jgi:2-polyprenyl-6-methoxyphenol hydroxylase-like FAD-dependent oxidoreductase
MMQPSGMAALDELGLLHSVLSRGAPITGIDCETSSRHRVLRVDYSRLQSSAFGVGLHRGVLFDALFDAACVEPGVRVHLGRPITACSVEQGTRSAAPCITFADGETASFDLVVVANGARSELRAASGLVRRDKPYPWGALWLVLEDPAQIFGTRLTQVVSGTREMLGFLPTGLGPEGQTPLVSVFWSIEAHKVEAFRRSKLTAWRARLLELQPLCAPLIEQVREPEQLLFASYRDVEMRRWHQPEGIVYLGDAAHAMSPQLGQGANLALVDALTLSRVLQSASTLAGALEQYTRQRRHELAYYQWATRMLTPFFQSHWLPLGWLRDAFMYPMSALPFGARKMARTLCGLERGVLLDRAKQLPQLSCASPRLVQALGSGD